MLTHQPMSAFRFDNRQLRRTARATLVVWLFALAAGVANACALLPAGSAGRGVAPASHVEVTTQDAAERVLAGAGHDGDHDQGGSVLPRGHGHDAGKVSCQKFCDDESSAIAKVKLPVVDLGAGLLAVVEGWNSMTAIGSPGFLRARDRHGPQGPPLVIRFLRLTL